MSGHTKGPWVVSCSVQVYSKGSGRIVAQPYTDSANGPVLAMDEQKANANLIAAAPDLLEALEKGVNRLEANLGDERDMGPESMAYLLETFQAAIAKARGEA